MAITNIAVQCGTVTRYATIPEFLGCVAGLPATFQSVAVPTGNIVPGPSTGAFNTLSTTVHTTTSSTAHADATLDVLEGRIAVLEAKSGPPQFADEFAVEFD